MIYTTDDLCLEYIDNFKLFDDIKRDNPSFKLISFTISNFKNNENLLGSTVFKDWYEKHKDWVEIAVHSYDHLYPPDADRDNQEDWIKKALDGLKPYLPKEYGYRSPGWQTTSKTVPILKKLGFTYIAYEASVKSLITNQIEYGVVNSHLYDIDSIKRLYEVLKNHAA
jgi:peptidoglycan/xylan/chitin deacetylase (PgdA/CDA1 family)